jgi:hypothetical protein
MNQLYKEIEQIRRKLVSNKWKYFGDKEFGNADNYTIILKNGNYYTIGLGTNNIPKVKKKDILYIRKKIMYNSNDKNFRYGVHDFIDTNIGFIRYSETDIYKPYNYLSYVFEKYHIDYDNCIDTGTWN